MIAQSAGAVCIACGGELGKNEKVRLLAAKLFVCSECGSWNYFPRVTATQQIELHDQADYAHHPYFETRRAQTERALARCRAIFAEIGKATGQRDFKGQRILDVGCGPGGFLEAARDLFGVDAVGIDVSKWAIDEVRKKGIVAHQATLEDADASLSDFPIVTAIDVIEHVADPPGLVQSIANRMSSGGVAYLETPNTDSIIYGLGAVLSRLSGGRPAGPMERLFPPHHIVYLSRDSIERAAEKSGLQLVSYFTRVLPADDIAVSPILRVGFAGLQLVDRVLGRRALTCFILRKT